MPTVPETYAPTNLPVSPDLANVDSFADLAPSYEEIYARMLTNSLGSTNLTIIHQQYRQMLHHQLKILPFLENRLDNFTHLLIPLLESTLTIVEMYLATLDPEAAEQLISGPEEMLERTKNELAENPEETITLLIIFAVHLLSIHDLIIKQLGDELEAQQKIAAIRLEIIDLVFALRNPS